MDHATARRLERARRYLDQGAFAAAQAQLDILRSLDPHGVQTRTLAARLAWSAGRTCDAGSEAREAMACGADEPDLLADLVDVLLLVGENIAARDIFEQPMWAQVDDARLLRRYATWCHKFGRHDLALAVFERLLAGRPDDGPLHHARAQQLEFLGHLDAAAEAYATCLDLTPDYGYAAYRLSRLPATGSPGRVQQLVADGLQRVQPGSQAWADFQFAHYHVLDAPNQYDAAWAALASANAATYALRRESAERDQQRLRQLVAHLPLQFSGPDGRADDGPHPIFIVGLPRSGTTLLERLLANHSQVAGGGEFTDFGLQLLGMRNTNDLFNEDSLAHMPALDFCEAGRRYRAQTRWRAGGRPFFTDKLPANWRLAGWIHRALPDCRIVHIVRDPMDTCFGLWRARFATANDWSYDFKAVAERHALYRRIMPQLVAACGDAVLEITYADLVNDTVATLKRVMAFCGLAWEPGCEDLARNTSPVTTLSSPQVHSAVNTHGLGRWQRYARQLEPLRALLARDGT